MKIVAVDVFKHWATWCNWLFVRISTDEGLVGWGEGSLHGPLTPVEATIEELSHLLLGQDPSGPERH